MYEKYFFLPTKRIADHIHKRGYFVNQHSCGKIEKLVPYIAQFADMWEGQEMNDKVAIKKRFGNKLVLTIGLDNDLVAKPDVTEGELVAHIRETIDTYGEDGGMVLFAFGVNQFTTDIIMNETFEYSRKKYGKA